MMNDIIGTVLYCMAGLIPHPTTRTNVRTYTAIAVMTGDGEKVEDD